MDPVIIGVLGTLAGVLAGGILTHWNSTALAKREMRWQQVRLRQEKLEEIATILEQIQQIYRKLVGDVINRVESNKPYNSTIERIPKERLRILIEFYAPSMLDDWPEFECARKLFSNVLADSISSRHRTKLEKQNLNGRAIDAEQVVSEVCRSLSEKAALLAHEAVRKET